MEFYEAMNYRGWVKSFLMDDLDTALINRVKHYVKYLRGLNSDCGEQVQIISYKEIKKKHMGIFSVKAPYYFVVYMNDLEKELMNAGFLMGQLALYLTTKEIGSYVTGIEKASKFLEETAMIESGVGDKGEELWMCIMAFGTPERKIRQVNKVIDKFVLEKKCVYKSPISDNMQRILNAAMYAPTKMIVRPYRFVIQENRIHVYAMNEALMTSYQRVTFYLDCGIMLAYLSVKAEELWMSMSVVQRNKLLAREQKHYQYITTLVLEDQ